MLGAIGDVGAKQAHRTGGGLERAGDAVEQRGLAGAIRADERTPLAGGDAQRHAVDGAQAAEHLGEVVNFDHGGHGLPFALPAAQRPARQRPIRPTMPLGAHSTVAMKATPITAVCSSKKLLTQLRSPRKMPAPRNGPTIVPDPPTIAISDTSTEIWNEAATGLMK